MSFFHAAASLHAFDLFHQRKVKKKTHTKRLLFTVCVGETSIKPTLQHSGFTNISGETNDSNLK